jgi:Na+-driven multidrug efflux pump
VTPRAAVRLAWGLWGLAVALLVGVHAGLVFLLGRLLGPATGDSALAVAASTLAVAALFQPASATLWLRASDGTGRVRMR